MSDSMEYKAGSALVDDGIFFKIPLIFGLNAKLEIKPLKPGTIVRICQEMTKIEAIDEKENQLQEFLAKGKNLKHIAAIISHAVINQSLVKKWKFRYYRWLMLNRTESLKAMYAYMGIVYRQMDAQQFFFIMALTPAMNHLMKKQTETTGQK